LNKEEINQESEREIPTEEFKYSLQSKIEEVDPTPKNLLVTVPELNCFIKKQTGSKSNFGATN
jgi:hypothetical protein